MDNFRDNFYELIFPFIILWIAWLLWEWGRDTIRLWRKRRK